MLEKHSTKLMQKVTGKFIYLKKPGTTLFKKNTYTTFFFKV